MQSGRCLQIDGGKACTQCNGASDQMGIASDERNAAPGRLQNAPLTSVKRAKVLSNNSLKGDELVVDTNGFWPKELFHSSVDQQESAMQQEGSLDALGMLHKSQQCVGSQVYAVDAPVQCDLVQSQRRSDSDAALRVVPDIEGADSTALPAALSAISKLVSAATGCFGVGQD